MSLKNLFVIKMSLQKFLMLLSTVLLAAGLLIASIILIKDVGRKIEAKAEEMGSLKFRQYTEYVDKNFEKLNNLADYMVKDESFKKILINSEGSMLNKISNKSQIETYLSKLASYNDVINSINIISSNKEHFYYGNLIFSENLVNTLSTIYSTSPVYSVGSGAQLAASIGNTFPLLIDELDNYTYMHFTICSDAQKSWDAWIILNKKLFFRDSEDIDSTAFVYDRTPLYSGSKLKKMESDLAGIADSNKQNSTGQVIKNTRIYTQKFPAAGITGLYAIDTAEYIGKIHSIKGFTTLIYLASLILAFAASRLISGWIIKPVNELCRLMDSYKLNGIAGSSGGRNIKRKFSLREKIFYYFIITIFIPVAFYFIVFYYQTQNVMRDIVTNSCESVFTKTSLQVNRAIENKIALLQKLSFENSVQDYLKGGMPGDVKELEDVIDRMRYLGLDRDNVTLYNIVEQVVFKDRYADQSNGEDSIMRDFNKGAPGVSCSVMQDKIGNKYLSIMMPVIYLGDGEYKSRCVGYCRIDIEFYRIKNVLSIIEGAGGKVGITDYTGNQIFADEEPLFERPVELVKSGSATDFSENDDKYTAYYNSIPGTLWYVSALFNTSEILEQSSSMHVNYVYILVVIAIVTLILSHFISVYLQKPIIKLNNVLKLYDIYGNYIEDEDYFEENYFIDEINNMSENFSEMAERIEALVDDLIIANNEKNRMELEKKSAEITALQAQINPHFLYNTLNNVIALIRTNSNDEAITAIKLLSALFKYGISREEIVIPIREEIEYTKAYAQIMKIRHKDRISFKWDIEEGALDFLTIKLILQPLIENSIRHGFNFSGRHGTVFIRCRENDDSIIFEVEDDGIGIEREELEKIEASLAEGNYGNRIGIFNVQSRLRLHYGKNYGLKLNSTHGKGICVTINIPKRKGNQNNPGTYA